ncbi:MAG: hypothetical protein ACLUFN_10310 [Eubacterium sp.]
MKKKTKFIIGLIAIILILIITSISIYFYYIESQENKVSAIGMYTLNYWIDENFEPNEEDEKTAQKTTITKSELLEYLEDLKVQGKIKDYRENPHCIAIDLINGGTFMYTFDLSNELQASSSNSSSDNSVKQSLDTATPLSVITAQPNNSSLSSTVFDDSATLIENANIGYKFVSNIDDLSVNLESLKTLSQYKVIIWDGHGGYDSVRHSYFQIGETWTNETINNYKDDVSAGRLVPLKDYTFAVTTAFFEENYEDDSFNDTLVYLGCCDGAMDSVLSDVLIKKGAEAVLAYNNAVYSSYNRNMCETIFNELVRQDDDTNSTKTAAEALETAKKQNGEKDPTSKRAWFEANYKNNDYRAELILTENDDNSFRLVDENKKDNSKENNKQAENLVAEQSDFDLFEDMLNKTCWVWQMNDSLDTNEISISELIENFIILDAVPCGLYTNFWDLPDNYYEQTDPKGIFSSGAYKLNADNVDWIIRNVFGLTPDRNVSSNEFYYDDGYLYRALELGGGIENTYEITETKELENGQYGFTVFTHENIEDWSKESEKTIYFSATLKNDSNMELYWSINKFSNNASIIGKNTSTNNTKEQGNNNLSEIYQPILEEYYTNCQKKHYTSQYTPTCSFCEYTLYDIDNDGVKELIIQDGTCEGDRTHHIYTYTDNKAELLGEYNAWHLALYGSDKKIIGVDGMGGSWTIYNIVISNNKVTKKEIKMQESTNSPKYSNELKFYDLNDLSAFS